MDRRGAGHAPIKALVAVVVLSAVLLWGPAPAMAAGGLPVTLAEAKPWHYWISIVLVASVVGIFFMLMLGYLVKVVALKYGIRIGRRSAG